jgi:hypothetical protein
MPPEDKKNDFYDKGFLGESIQEFTSSVITRYEQFFAAANKLVELGYAVMMNLKLKNDNLPQVLVATVLIRVLNAFQSVIILSRYGLVFDAKVVLRGQLESLFILKRLSEDESFVTDYIASDLYRRLLWMNVARESKAPHFDRLRKQATDEVIADLKQEIVSRKAKKLDIEQIAERAGLKVEYDTDYRLLCEETHTLPRSLQNLTVFDKGVPTELDPNPTNRELSYVLFTAIRAMHIALEAVTKFFGVDQSRNLKSSVDTLAVLAPLVAEMHEREK